MKNKRFISFFLVTLLLVSLSMTVFAGSTDPNGTKSDKVVYPKVIYAPPERDIINGVEEGEETEPDVVTPMIVYYDSPVFIDYIPDSVSTIPYYKLIAKSSYYNEGPGISTMALDITQSSSSGSTFSGNVTFTSSVKAGILGKVEAEAGVGLELSKSTNEAVGYYYEYNVPAEKTGYIEAYWEGVDNYGTLVVKYPDTYSETGYTPNQYIEVDSVIHQSNNVINAKAYSR